MLPNALCIFALLHLTDPSPLFSEWPTRTGRNSDSGQILDSDCTFALLQKLYHPWSYSIRVKSSVVFVQRLVDHPRQRGNTGDETPAFVARIVARVEGADFDTDGHLERHRNVDDARQP